MGSASELLVLIGDGVIRLFNFITNTKSKKRNIHGAFQEPFDDWYKYRIKCSIVGIITLLTFSIILGFLVIYINKIIQNLDQ